MVSQKQETLLKTIISSEAFASFCCCLAIWLAFFTTSNLFLFSSFHFIDDHEITVIHSDLQNMNILEVFRKWLLVDYSIPRFRPFYYIHRVLQTQFFGLHWSLWYAYACLQASLTTFLLFLFARFIGFVRLEAALLAGLTMFGQQAITWWRIGPAETTGMPFLAAALVLASSSCKKRLNILRDSFLILFTLLASLCKESFILFIPAICLIRGWQIYRAVPHLTLKRLLRHQEFLPCYILLLIGTLEILYIKFVIGTGGTGYAGVDSKSLGLERLLTIFSILFQAGSLWICLLFLAIFCVCLLIKRQAKRKTDIHRSGLISLEFLTIIFPQILLYAKSGISGHYLFPALIGCSLLNIQTLALYRQNGLKWLRRLLTVILSIVIVQQAHLAWAGSHDFALEGQSTKSFFSQLETCTRRKSPILVVANPRVHYELSFSLHRYLNNALIRRNLFISTYGKEGADFKSDALPTEVAWGFLDPKAVKDLYDSRSIDSIANKRTIRSVIVFPGLRDDFLNTSKSWFRSDRYRLTEYDLHSLGGSLSLYCKK